MLAELLAVDGVEERLVLRPPTGPYVVGVMALHGGLEAETAEMAAEVADAAGASLYAVVQPDDHRWHIPSVNYTPTESACLRRFLGTVDVAFSLHGFGRPGLEEAVLLGGSNRMVAGHTAAALRRHGARDLVARLRSIPRKLRGMHPLNPVNLTRLGGVQVELGPDARTGAPRDTVVGALVSALAWASVGGPPS